MTTVVVTIILTTIVVNVYFKWGFMAAGGGVTYPRVVKLLTEATAAKGQRAVAREAGIALLSVQRYIKGESEPSLITLRKLAGYFGKSITWLRGEADTEGGDIVLAVVCGVCGASLRTEAMGEGLVGVWPCSQCNKHSCRE